MKYNVLITQVAFGIVLRKSAHNAGLFMSC